MRLLYPPTDPKLRKNLNYNECMSLKDDMVLYKQRWEAVAEVEREELRTIPIEKKWQQLNTIVRMAYVLGLFEPDPSEEVVYERWARLKDKASPRSQ